jgi:hypothetical protein
MNTFEIVVGIIGVVGVLLSAYFGFRSWFLSQDIESLRAATKAQSQALYNNLWRMGGNAEAALKADSPARARELVQGIADMSQTARHSVISFSGVHARFVPFDEPAWKPAPLAPEPPERFFRKFFQI